MNEIISFCMALSDQNSNAIARVHRVGKVMHVGIWLNKLVYELVAWLISMTDSGCSPSRSHHPSPRGSGSKALAWPPPWSYPHPASQHTYTYIKRAGMSQGPRMHTNAESTF